jgi:hypothetical protein
VFEGVFLFNFQLGRDVTSLCGVLRNTNSCNDNYKWFSSRHDYDVRLNYVST